MRLIVLVMALALAALNTASALAQTGTLAPGICFTRIASENNKSTRLYVDGGLKDMGEVTSIKIIAVGQITIIEATYSQGKSAYNETIITQNKRLDMFLALFKPAEVCPSAPAAAPAPAN